MIKVNYDNVADVYNLRYQRSYKLEGLAEELKNIAESNDAKTILEVGCGIGHWLKVFQDQAFVIGLDVSFNMLSKANLPNSKYQLIQGTSDQLPFREKSFDFIYSINAIHHFQNPYGFIEICKSLLKEKGIFVSVCMNPHAGSDDWFVYDYF